MRFDSCRQCIRRRIQCDAGNPECQKCKKKGISCSGVGKKYRFVNCDTAAYGLGIASRTVPATSGHLLATDQNAAVRRNLEHKDDSEALTANSDVEAEVVSHAVPVAEDDGRRNLGERRQSALMRNGYLQLLNPRALMLFDYFSSTVAPAMVVIDDKWNGYRNIILPLATTDPLVQRAVMVVAALHLARKRVDLLEPAERGKAAIVERLHKDALLGQLNQICNVSTWATVVLLLVGETVTGDQGFVHLFPMLNSLLEALNDHNDLETEATFFLRQQTQMFKLFTPPFLDPTTGVTALKQHLHQYLDFLSHPTNNPEVSSALETIKESIYLARDLYLKETRNELDTTGRWLVVEHIKQLVHPIETNTSGMHALVWTYFIAGAASSDHAHRAFFLKRLHQVYDKTGMRNVLAAIDLLQNSVWSLPKDQNWSTSHAVLNRVLIM